MANSTVTPSPAGSCSASDSDAAVPDFWLGVFASLTGSVILNLGLNIQKYAYMRRAKLEMISRGLAKNLPPLYKDPVWILGFFVFAIGNFGDFIGLTFAPQSVITPIGSISLVSNLVFARMLLGEKLDCRTFISIIAIIIGVVCIVYSSSQSNSCSEFTLRELLERWTATVFLIFAICLMCAVISLFIFVRCTEKKLKGNLENLSKSQQLKLRLSYPLLGSLFAAWTVLLSKSVGELFKYTVRGTNQFDKWQTYFLLGGFLISLPCQIIYINKGLAYFEALYVVPIFYSMWVITSITMGALYFSEFQGFEAWQFVLFFVGVALDIAGGILLQGRTIDETPTTAMENRRGSYAEIRHHFVEHQHHYHPFLQAIHLLHDDVDARHHRHHADPRAGSVML